MSAPTIPNLHGLRAFEAAARHESFQRAADELGLTPSAISRHVRALETELGHPLFERLHRAVALTEDGARYAARVTAAFDGLAVRPAARSRARVVIDDDADLLRLWLLPRLTPDVLNALDLDAVLRARADRPRILPADTDVAIVWGALDYEGFAARTLLSPRVFVVAAPSLGLSALADVARARLLNDRDASWWRALHEAVGLTYPEDAASLTFDRCDPRLATRLRRNLPVLAGGLEPDGMVGPGSDGVSRGAVGRVLPRGRPRLSDRTAADRRDF